MSECNFQARGIALAAFLGLLLASAALSQTLVIRGTCVGVHDGDSCTLLRSGNVQIKIRIAFLDAPELGQPFGYRAKQAMSQLVFDKEIAVYPHAIDRYGRTVGVVYVDGIDAGLELLRQGLAWTYTRYLPNASADIQASYRQAETEAREQRRGLWSDSQTPVPPWEYRHATKPAL
jgi:endonuclease YncB( thermonuclease family)